MSEKILPKELAILSDIQKEFGFKLTERKKIGSNVGYTLKNGRITELGLFRKKVTDITIICKLQYLEKLDLNQNEITAIPLEICNLKKLIELRFTGNSLTSIHPSLFKLTSLKELWLNGNKIAEIPSEISRLTSLELLGLGDNKLCEIPSEIGNLSSLVKLWLSENEINSIPEELCNLSNLRILKLDSNKLAKLPENIGNLEKLSTIDISNNRIGIIPNSIGSLNFLSSFLISNNKVEALPKSFYNLTSLNKLILSGNSIKTLSENISNLTELKSLDLKENNLYELPNSIAKLTALKNLICKGNDLSVFPSQVSEIKSLVTLFLDKNKIKSVPRSIENLTKLENFGLSLNELCEFPECIQSMHMLKEISINGNKITKLPSWVASLKINLIWKARRVHKGSNQGLNLHGNPFEEPPIEIVANGKEAVKDYFDDFKKSKPEDMISLYEGKLLIVGEGDVGKTHIANRLMFDKIPGNNSTQGIDIHDWKIDTKSINNFRVNLWDFAGQAICHSTHQFFLTSRSLYLFVWEARSDQDVTHFDYWLNIIKLLSNSSPVLIVMNKCDVREKAIDQVAIQKEFPNVIGFHKISALKGLGIDELKDRIYNEMESLPMIGKKLIKQWVKIREELEARQSSHFITYKEYLDICLSFNINNEKAARIAQYYHDIGVILHFRDDPILKGYVVLNPEWATDAVYAIVDNRNIQQLHGKFNFADLASIWTEYPEESHLFIIELMKKFELCFELPKGKDFIVPELLNPTQAEFDWEYEGNLCLQYQYAFMPAGIITRFTVRQHEIIYQDKYWKNGVCIQWDDSNALVICDPFSKNITIRITGSNPKGLLAVIRKDIESIHESLNNPMVEERIPCICTDCRSGAQPSFHLYSKINKFRKINKRTIECDSGNDIVINELLGEYGMAHDTNSGNDTYNIYGGNVAIGNEAKVNSGNIENHNGTVVGGDVSIKNKMNKPIEMKWYRSLKMWLGIIASIITIYVFIYPPLKDNKANHSDAIGYPVENAVEGSSEYPVEAAVEAAVAAPVVTKNNSSIE